MLAVTGLNVFHGNLQVIWDLSFRVEKGELVTLIGPNGAGKTTTVETIIGLNRNASGSIIFEGEDILGHPPNYLFKKGLALVPEKREIFSKMPVSENLLLGGIGPDGNQKTLSHIYQLFPILREREHQMAGTLSGGEQQMLAIGRALMSRPRLLILDEPSTGLSPLLVGQVFRALEQTRQGGYDDTPLGAERPECSCHVPPGVCPRERKDRQGGEGKGASCAIRTSRKRISDFKGLTRDLLKIFALVRSSEKSPCTPLRPRTGPFLSPFLPPCPHPFRQVHEPLWQEDDREDENEPDYDVPAERESRFFQPLPDDREHNRSDDRSCYGTEASEDYIGNRPE